MGKRGRPRKNPTPEPESNGNNEETIITPELGETNNPTEFPPQEILPDTSQPKPLDTLPPNASDALQVPTEWSDIPIIDLAKQGWTYRRRPDNDGRIYMAIRNRTNEKSLGRWSREREKILFEVYPILFKPKKVETETPMGIQTDGSKGGGNRPFFNVPIKRIAVVPGDYRPTMDVIRYYHIYKNNGFLGDFSDFMNGIIATHFIKCHGVFLPVYVNEELIEQHA